MLVSSDQEEVLFWLAMWFPVETHVTKFNMPRPAPRAYAMCQYTVWCNVAHAQAVHMPLLVNCGWMITRYKTNPVYYKHLKHKTY